MHVGIEQVNLQVRLTVCGDVDRDVRNLAPRVARFEPRSAASIRIHPRARRLHAGAEVKQEQSTRGSAQPSLHDALHEVLAQPSTKE